jgi:hypothetical protein
MRGDLTRRCFMLEPLNDAHRSGIVVSDMDPCLKQVTRIPLQELWRSNGIAIGPRGRTLNSDDIVQLLSKGPIEFVVADVGRPLVWTDSPSYEFWKTEVKPHLAEPDSPIILDSFSGGYCYTASQWDDEMRGVRIVLLEKHH